MEIEDWMPLYHQIVQEFSYSEKEDQASAKILMDLVGERSIDIDVLRARIGSTVTVCGGADSLLDDVHDYGLEGTIVTAGTATKKILSTGLMPDVLVTDLDGPVASEVDANLRGCIALIHAHGDNIAKIRKWSPLFLGPVIPTCQSYPHGVLSNFGGFTDGDRAVIMARHFGAKNIRLLGFDFDNPAVKKGSYPATKLRKLKWARRLIFDLNPSDVILWTPRSI